MDFSSLHWGSPLGLGLFFAGMGLGMWGFFNGIAAMIRAKAEEQRNERGSGFPVQPVEPK